MKTLPFEGLTADKARSYFIDLGAEAGRRHVQSAASEKTLVVMNPLDADFFGLGFLHNCGPIANLRILWCHTSTLPNGDTVASIVHRYNSSQTKPDKVVVLASLGLNPAELRTMVFQATNEGVPIRDVEIVCPFMSGSVWESLSGDFGSDLAEGQHANLSLVPDDLVRAYSLETLLNLPGSGLTYLPACVFPGR